MSTGKCKLLVAVLVALVVLIGCQATPKDAVPEEGVLLAPPTPTSAATGVAITGTQTIEVTPS